MVTDYGGAKGPRALGPLFLEDGSFPSPPLVRRPSLAPIPQLPCLSSFFVFVVSSPFTAPTPFRLPRKAPTAIPNYLYSHTFVSSFRLEPSLSSSEQHA